MREAVLKSLRCSACAAVLAAQLPAVEFSVTLPEDADAPPLDGRLLLCLSGDPKAEPRFQINDGPNTQMVFGLDVEGWRSGTPVIVGDNAFGYPVRKLSAVRPGEYIVQAVLNRYETFRRAGGHVVKLPMDYGEGQQWNRKPGNLFSLPAKVRIGNGAGGTIPLTLDRKIPPIPEPADTRYVRHVKIRSERLSAFWGRDMYLGAHVLVPEGFDEHPEARYPLMLFHGHFPADLSGFRTEPPDPNLEPDYSERFRVHGYNRIVEQEAYEFYRKWTGASFPRFLVVEIQHANPFYDDSYAVNSANLGPYGDAIMYELVPYIERLFRGIGQGWARFTYGGSTGGWEAMAAQIFYPGEFNGAFCACPDPIDFRAFTVVDIYQDGNAYYREGPHKRVPRPGMRNYLGHVSATLEDLNLYELALGGKSRSGQQWDIWEAVFSPAGPDGYPRRIWNKLTGEIDRETAEYWREHFDLGHILKRDWPKLGTKLRGKLHIYCGDMDNYYLNNAVYLVEETLKELRDPPAEAEVAYGDRFEHCWNGHPTLPNHISRLRYNTIYLDKILQRIAATAPPGADLASWRY